ncbi:MAG: NAD-dependent epimerase/dehydratase family protein [Clostridiales bacterium]|nr:NAD-dependent epimerase/dehydratase family protein [Clostridiales bacterium]
MVKKRVLITGANSYIGTSVEKYVLENYPEDCAFDTIDLKDSSWREKDFSDYDVVFHVAGIAHQKETKENAENYYKINRDLVVEVATKAKSEGVRQFIQLSSMSVYGLTTGKITLDTETKPNTNYGKSKLEAEEKISVLADENFKVCILRPPMIYGKNCKGNYQTLVKFANKLKIFPYVKNQRSMLYIDNLSEFIRLMIVNEESGIFFPQNAEYTNTSDMVKAIAIAHGKKLHLIHGFGWAIKLMGLFIGLAKKAFGSLTYDVTMSNYKEDYVAVKLMDSIKNCESEDNE